MERQCYYCENEITSNYFVWSTKSSADKVCVCMECAKSPLNFRGISYRRPVVMGKTMLTRKSLEVVNENGSSSAGNLFNINSLDYATMYEGMSLLVNCLNEIIDSTGERDRLTIENKDRIVKAYFKARRFLPSATLKDKLNIGENRIRQWASDKKCEKSIIKKCFSVYTGQLSISEQDMLKKYLYNPEYSNLPRNHIWAKARREGLFTNLAPFYKYVQALEGLREAKEENKHKNKVVTIRARKPLTILHMDSTIITCLNGERVFVHFIMDNYSRKILGAVPTYSSKSEVVAMNLKQVIMKNRLYDKYIKLYCDDGPENHAYVKDLIRNDSRIRIDRIIGTYNFQRNNNMIEQWNHKLKYIVLKKYKPESFKHLELILPEMIKYSNNLHLPVLNTLSPNEAIKGKKKKEIYNAIQVRMAKRKRKIENLRLRCEELCPHVKPIYFGKKQRKQLNDWAVKKAH